MSRPPLRPPHAPLATVQRPTWQKIRTVVLQPLLLLSRDAGGRGSEGDGQPRDAAPPQPHLAEWGDAICSLWQAPSGALVERSPPLARAAERSWRVGV